MSDPGPQVVVVGAGPTGLLLGLEGDDAGDPRAVVAYLEALVAWYGKMRLNLES